MSPEDARRIADLFDQAVELPPEERSRWLAGACGDSTEVWREVEALLKADATLEAAAGTPFWRGLAAGWGDAPRRVGPYRLIRRLGEGGMSEVFLGLRDDGELEQRVAVKLIRRELLTAEMVRRFETERQILASLNHPGIARLLGAGRTPAGVPYFIMEFIEGEPIDLYCDRHRLSIAERLHLFRQVCLAVHFAHQNLVVHRDIKPSNILVTEAGQPKLLDFGIAKLLNPDLAARGSEPTLGVGRLLTPEYASPEQILGKPVTTTSDVYGLGVLLFRLLGGQDPYRLRERSPADLEQRILTAEPDAPSACVRRLLGTATALQLAELRNTKPRALVRALTGDLDAVIAKALRKEPQNRYVSVEHMAEDLRRHLAGGRPAAASWSGYPARWWLAAGAVLTLALVTTASLLVLQSSRLAEMRAAAEREGPGRSFQPIFAARFRQDFAGRPETHADLLMSFGRACYEIGLFDEAASSIQEALTIRRQTLGPEHEKVAESLTALADVDVTQGDFEGAKVLHLKALALRRRLHPGESLEVAESLVGLARVFLAKRHPAHAEPLLLEALKTREKLLVDGDVRIAEALTDLGHAVDQLGNPSSAELVFRKASTMYGRASAESWELTASLIDEADAQLEQGKRAEGETLLRKMAKIERDRCGGESVELAALLANLAAAALGGASAPAVAGDLRSSDSPACRMPRLAEPHLSFLLQGLGDALTDLGHPIQGRGLLQKARVAHRLVPHPPPLEPDPLPATSDCVPDGGFAEPYRGPCCSGVIAAGTTFCSNPEDWGTTWRTCRHVCGSRLVNGCIPRGGITDVLGLTDCCSGLHDSDSVRCLDPADHGVTDRTCVMTCR